MRGQARQIIGTFGIAGLCFGTLIAAGATSARADSEPAPVTAAFFDGEPGSFYPGQLTFTSVRVISASTSALRFEVSDGTNSYEIDFGAPGAQFVAGNYYDALRFGFAGAGSPGLDIFGMGAGCNEVFGQFIVDDATFDQTGNLLSFSARFEHHCDHHEEALFGVVSYSSMAPYRTRTISPDQLTFPHGAGEQQLTIHNDGPAPLHPANFAFSGPIAGSLSISANSCTTELAPGGDCNVSIDYDGSQPGDAAFTFSDELAPLGQPNQPNTTGTGRDIAIHAVPAQLTIDTTPLNFGPQRVGTFGAPQVVTISNDDVAPVGVARIAFAGQHPFDYFGATDCINRGRTRILQPGQNCHIVLFFSPLRAGSRSAQLSIVQTTPTGARIIPLHGSGTEGYIIAGAQGEVGTFGDAVYHGDATNIHLSQPMISLATTPNGAGYWLLARDGGIFGYGNARFYGSTGAMKLNKPIVAMTASHDGKGYRLVASDGGIFGYGDARFYGSTGSIRLNRPIVGMAATIDDHGYWLVASDGGIFGFGDAHYYGSAASAHLASSVIQIAPTPSGHGYWLLTAGGHVYGYGDAHVYGTVVGQRVIGMASTPDGRGYWIATRTGAIYHFGNAPGYGDIRDLGVNDVIGIAASAPALPPALLPFSNTSARADARGYSPIPGGGNPPGSQYALR